MGVLPIIDDILLPTCCANTAFCLIKAEQIDHGLKHLESLSFYLKVLNRGQLSFHPADLPGIAIWVDEDRLIEEKLSSALALIQKAIRASADEQIHPDILDVAEAYEKGASIVLPHC